MARLSISLQCIQELGLACEQGYTLINFCGYFSIQEQGTYVVDIFCACVVDSLKF